jgi:thiol:disulfide interchange protein DsbC
MRKLLMLVMIAAVTMLCASGVSAFATKAAKEKNCATCHTLKQAEAETLLKPLAPDFKALSITQAPVKGLWEVYGVAGGRKVLVYVDYGKKFFVPGNIIDIQAKKNITQDRYEELGERYATKIDVAKIPTADALVLGDANAAYKVIVFSDPDCPFCKAHEEMKKVVEKRKDIAFLIKLYPLPMHKDALWKSKTIVCEKSMQLLEDNFAGKEIPKKECDAAKAIDENLKLAPELGITGTPAMIMPDGRVIPGYREADQLIEAITKKK